MQFLELFTHDARHPLLFHSGTFFFVFTLFVAVYALLGPRRSARLWWALAFSYFYYYKCNGLFALALVFTTTVDWALARRIHSERRSAVRKLLVALSVVLSLSVLGYFKYTNFVLGNLAWLRGGSFQPLAIFLPIGISFYTFQSISYVVDVYRGDVEPSASLVDYAFFLSFFPQIVAGPIVRASILLPQIQNPAEPTREDVARGLDRIVQGLVKKAIIADYVGLFSDLVFNSPGGRPGPEILLGIYAYTLQIYFDFSGYSDIAIGMARILGIQLPENFESPYRATNITEFWRRWHISLSTWLRDYLYIPLGGNRRGKVRQYLNLMITMLLGGLWHGASWNFVVWGGAHGVALAAHKLWSGLMGGGEASLGRRLAGWVFTLHFVILLWVFFRAASFADAWTVLTQLTTSWDLAHLRAVVEARRWQVLAMAVGAFVALSPAKWAAPLSQTFVRAPALAKAAVFLLLVQSVVQLQGSNVPPFIYFQF